MHQVNADHHVGMCRASHLKEQVASEVDVNQ